MTSKFFLAGNVVSDPTPIKGGARITVADNGPKGDPQFHDVVTFGKLADAQLEHLSKGRPVAISGRIDQSSYENDAGETVYKTGLIADSVEWLSGGAKRDAEVDGPEVA